MRIPKIIFASLAVALLCIGSATVAHADVITFTGSRNYTGGQTGVPNPVRCGPADPNYLVTDPTDMGTSNLGSFTSTQSRCVNTTTGNIFNGLFTFTFASGDTLTGTYFGALTGAFNPNAFSVLTDTENYTVTGGTGLFAGATGNILGIGTLTFTPGIFPLSAVNLNGTITTTPEPTTMVLLGTGLAAIAAKVRRRRKAPCDDDVT